MANRRMLVLGAVLLGSIALIPVATALGNGGSDSTPTQSIEGLTALGNGFTYQGRLTDSGSPANGNYDLRFVLYDSDVGGTQIGNTIALNSVPVTNGLFTVTLDFGAPATATATATASPTPSPTVIAAPGVWDGNSRWVEIAVRTAGASSYTILSPRQPVTPVPYALYAKAAGGFSLPFTGSGASSAASPVASTTGLIDITQGGTGIAIAGRKPATTTDLIPAVYGLNGGQGAGVQGETTNPSGVGVQGFGSVAGGTGVSGISTAGTGGFFQGVTALQLDGAIRVSGTKSAFQVAANLGVNTCGTPANSILYFSNPLTDGDPNAMIFVTEVGNPTPSGSPIAVTYGPASCAAAAGKWTLSGPTAFATGQKFSLLVIKQ